MAIHQAYERVKEIRGLKIKRDFIPKEGEEGFTSVRPNSHQYTEDFSEFDTLWGKTDRRVFTSTLNEAEYEGVKKSMETIDAIRNNMFEIKDVELKRTDDRFKLNETREVIAKRSQKSPMINVFMWFIPTISIFSL